MRSDTSAKISLWVNRVIVVALAVLLLTMPRLLEWYRLVRPLDKSAARAIFFGFYTCTPVVFYALWCIDRLLRIIRSDRVFVTSNVRFIRRIRWCCVGVSLICLPAAFFYLPLIFLAVIMGFLALMVSVVKNVMAAAVEIREENDLTV